MIEQESVDAELILNHCATAAPHLRFTVVADGAAALGALEATRHAPYDSVVLNVALPDIDGLDLLRTIVTIGYQAPVVALAGADDTMAAVEAMKAGARDCLVKLSDYWSFLPRAIESAVDRHRLAEENRRLQDTLSTHASMMDAAFESLADAMLVMDASGSIMRRNAAAARFLAQVPAEAWRRPLEQALHGIPARGEIVHVHPDDPDSQVWMVNATPVRNAQGQVRLVAAVFHDVSELKRLEQLKDEILSIASHELKNPLTVIMGYSSMLAKMQHIQEHDRVQRAVGAIRQQSQRMQRLIDQLLDLSRLGLGRLTLQYAPFDLVQQVQTIVAQQQAIARDHRIHIRIADEPLMVVGDVMRLEQVLVNMIANAIRYSPDDSEIVVALRRVESAELPSTAYGDADRSAQYALVQVSDDGVGVDPAARPYLFKRYYRTPGVEGNAVGQGLGLYISAQIVRLHGGLIWFESEPGKGSTFSYTLPIGP